MSQWWCGNLNVHRLFYQYARSNWSTAAEPVAATSYLVRHYEVIGPANISLPWHFLCQTNWSS